ncbi:IS3 family transposase [uncultured Mobiluncus sp.]|uniref:IS3 family transposase n=1 Tax=uncultured Mobiluncus sp. TaxID=293425 RepID=UPI002629D832|nr:IS3 family transposase [uncultured Mobiluncus sp.]
MPRKYSQEFRDRAVGLVFDRLRDDPGSRAAIISDTGLKLGVSRESLRRWVVQAEIDQGERPGVSREESAEIRRLRKENAELKRTNEILKLASAFFTKRARPPRDEMIAFIDEYRDCFSVERICRVMREHTVGGFITSRGYRAAKSRTVCARRLRDAVLVEEIVKIFDDNFRVYGIRKIWRAMRRTGWDIGQEQTGRLMRLAGICGACRGRRPVTTRPSKAPGARPNLVNRQFSADRPNRLWVADITYVRTLSGFVYIAFVTDVYSRKIVGWATRSSMKTEVLPLQALEQAIALARDNLAGLVHHCDHGSQYTSIAYNDKLTDYGIKPSTGTVGDTYDNDLAETVNGLYKTELIYSQTWETLSEVEFATMNWVYWWNNTRLHESLNYSTPEEVITRYNQTHAKQLAPT